MSEALRVSELIAQWAPYPQWIVDSGGCAVWEVAWIGYPGIEARDFAVWIRLFFAFLFFFVGGCAEGWRLGWELVVSIVCACRYSAYDMGRLGRLGRVVSR